MRIYDIIASKRYKMCADPYERHIAYRCVVDMP